MYLDNTIVRVLACLMSDGRPTRRVGDHPILDRRTDRRLISRRIDAMTLTRRPSPFGEFVTLRQAMDRLVDDTVFRPYSSGNGA